MNTIETVNQKKSTKKGIKNIVNIITLSLLSSVFLQGNNIDKQNNYNEEIIKL